MKYRIFIICCLMLLGVIASRAQNVIIITNAQAISNMNAMWLQDFTNLSKASKYPNVTNWGEANCNCQLSIGMDTNIVHAGAGAIFYFWIKNSSTGNIRSTGQSWNLFLTNNFGKTYPIDLNPVINAPIPYRTDANPGEFILGGPRIMFSHAIESGDYVLKFTRDITTADGKVCTLTSNPLRIKVVTASPP